MSTEAYRTALRRYEEKLVGGEVCKVIVKEEQKHRENMFKPSTRAPGNNKWSSHKWAAKQLRKSGYQIVTEAAGWPDLLVKHPSSEQLFAVEVKGYGDSLKDQQITTIEHLKKILPVFVLRIAHSKDNPDEVWFDELHTALNTMFNKQPEYFGA